jgi:hypothetical protein
MENPNLLKAIVDDPRYQACLDWGEPRPGHAEGTVRAHIAELEANLETLRHRLHAAACEKLRILIHVHDTFKGDAEQGVAITHPRSHASLARAFLAGFCHDEDLLAMVQYHDEGHALWRGHHYSGRINEGRLDSLLAAIRDWDLFLAFCVIDGCTASKNSESIRWFVSEIARRRPTTVTAAWIDDLERRHRAKPAERSERPCSM